MAVFKYLNPNYVEGGSEPKWIKIPLTGSAVITPVQSTGQSEVDIMSQKAVTDALNTKQNTLVSGTNIKTINDETILGNGNISIEVPDVSNFVTEVEVDQKISSLVASAPETLDTLNELAAALGDDPNFATTVTNKIAAKQDKLVSGTNIKTINGQSLVGTGNITTVGRSNGVGETFNSSTNVATGANSHAEGANTNASGNNSHTEGSFTQAKNNYEHAEGHYNLSHQDGTHAGTTRHSVGMGNSDEDRKNAFEIMADGSAYMMDLGGYDGINYASATSVQDVIKGKQDALVSGNTIKTINNQSLLGSGNISLLSNPVSGTLNINGTTSDIPTINIKRDDNYRPSIILSEGGQGGLASIVIQHGGTEDAGATITRYGIAIADKSSSDLLTADGSTTTLKTINNQSLLGNGNITIESGASGDYLPLSGGEMTGYISWENNKSVIDDCELHFNSSLSTGEDRTRLTMESDYLSISYTTANDDQTGHIIASVTKNDGPSISVSDDQTDAAIVINNTGIKYKNGGNNTTVFTTDGGTASLGNYATTASVSQAVSDATFNNGHNAVSSVAGIPVSKRLVIATISNNGSFALASTPADGREIHVIVHNTSSSDIEITMPSGSNYVKMSGDTLTVAGNSYADINVISDGTNMYIRAL